MSTGYWSFCQVLLSMHASWITVHTSILFVSSGSTAQKMTAKGHHGPVHGCVAVMTDWMMDMYNFLKFAYLSKHSAPWSMRQPQTVTAIPWQHLTADRMYPGSCCLFQMETIIRSIMLPCVKCSHLCMRSTAQSHYVSILVLLNPQQILYIWWCSEQNMNKKKYKVVYKV